MTDRCLTCSQEIKLGKLIEKEGKKHYEKFQLDGTTPHKCPEKEQKPRFPPRKPQDRFSYDRYVESDNGKDRRVYWMQRSANAGELNPSVVFKELEDAVEAYVASKKKEEIKK